MSEVCEATWPSLTPWFKIVYCHPHSFSLILLPQNATPSHLSFLLCIVRPLLLERKCQEGGHCLRPAWLRYSGGALGDVEMVVGTRWERTHLLEPHRLFYQGALTPATSSSCPASRDSHRLKCPVANRQQQVLTIRQTNPPLAACHLQFPACLPLS